MLKRELILTVDKLEYQWEESETAGTPNTTKNTVHSSVTLTNRSMYKTPKDGSSLYESGYFYVSHDEMVGIRMGQKVKVTIEVLDEPPKADPPTNQSSN